MTPKLTFFTVGCVLWAIGGFMVAIIGLQPVVPLETLKENQELAQKVMGAWGSAEIKITAIWGLFGGILGVVIGQLFAARPRHEHYTPAPGMEDMPRMPGGISGPKSMAEIKAGFQGWILGLILGVTGMVLIIPMFQNEFLVANTLSTRVIVGAIMSLISTASILPFSIKLIVWNSQRRY